ncbi:MAG: hypothetical protein LBC85_12320 [Fibromonadaceae bacterium]|jgi:hypothetical protein|nr:hypothetical protein [Fibromonadaceae bacterium]
MKISRFFLIILLLLVISCDTAYYGPAFVTVTNNSEHNITRVMVGDVDANLTIVNEASNELIAKSGGSKTFEVSGKNIPGKFIVCVEAEDTSEPMCTVRFALRESDKIFFTWGGDNSSVWQSR